jgi:hypothetical protein
MENYAGLFHRSYLLAALFSLTSDISHCHPHHRSGSLSMSSATVVFINHYSPLIITHHHSSPLTTHHQSSSVIITHHHSSSFIITHHHLSSLIAHYSLLIAHCSLLIAHCSLLNITQSLIPSPLQRLPIKVLHHGGVHQPAAFQDRRHLRQPRGTIVWVGGVRVIVLLCV